MTKHKLSMSEKIRRQLDLGKTPKEISKYLKCSTGLVYAVRSADKKKVAKKTVKTWESAHTSTSKHPVKNTVQIRADILDTIVANKPGAVRYGETVFVPKDYAVPKRNFVQRFFNWLCGG